MLKHFTDLPHSFVDVKVQFSSDVERDSLIATTLILYCDKRHTHRVTLLSRVRDLRGPRINRQIQQSIAALLCGKVLFDFLACSASSRGHFFRLKHTHLVTAWLLASRGCLHACVHLGDLPTNTFVESGFTEGESSHRFIYPLIITSELKVVSLIFAFEKARWKNTNEEYSACFFLVPSPFNALMPSATKLISD